VGVAVVEAVVVAEATAGALALDTVEVVEVAAAVHIVEAVEAVGVTAEAVVGDRMAPRVEVADRVPPQAAVAEAVPRPGLRVAESRAEKCPRLASRATEETVRVICYAKSALAKPINGSFVAEHNMAISSRGSARSGWRLRVEHGCCATNPGSRPV